MKIKQWLWHNKEGAIIGGIAGLISPISLIISPYISYPIKSILLELAEKPLNFYGGFGLCSRFTSNIGLQSCSINESIIIYVINLILFILIGALIGYLISRRR